jgi:energy-coupling factor transport system ATP-binding protein
MNAYIELDSVGFGYKKTGFSINDVSLKFFSGEAAVLTGGNGSGKTTLSKLMMGILKPDKGRVLVCGQDIKKSSLPSIAKKAGYLFQNPERHLFCETALDEIKFSLLHCGQDEASAEENAKELLSRFSMLERAGDFPLKLSRGEKQRLALLSVIAMKPSYYILDEPSSGIDEENKRKLVAILEELKAGGAGLCVITHDKALTERLADRVIVMSQGRVENEKA